MNSNVSSNCKDNRYLRTSKLIYILISLGLFVLYLYLTVLRFGTADHFRHPKLFLLFDIIYVLGLSWLVRVYDGFYFGFSSIPEIIFSLSISTTIINCGMYVLIGIYLNYRFSIAYMVILCFVDLALNIAYAFIGQKIYFRHTVPQRTLIVYRDQKALAKLKEVYEYPHYFNVTKYIEAPEKSSDVIADLADSDIVIIAGIKPKIRNAIVKYCLKNNIQAYVEPGIGDVIMAGGSYVNAFNIPVVRVGRAAPTPEFLIFKRICDIIISLTAIVVLSPFMLISALLIKLGDHGPVFYKQVRLTSGGRTFEILKFRSMRVDAEKDGVARLAAENDDRITPVGKFLRSCRMDELPQLFNVLKGDMSIVGPRPERPEIAEQYMDEIPTFDLRLQVKAGITGFAQVYGKYNTEPYDKLQMDLIYINNMSIINDLWLMFATVKVLFKKESTSGVEAGQVTAAKESTQEETTEERETVGTK